MTWLLPRISARWKRQVIRDLHSDASRYRPEEPGARHFIIADVIKGTVLTFVGLPGLLPLPWWQTLAIFAYAMVSCLVVNDAVKVAMIKQLVPTAAA